MSNLEEREYAWTDMGWGPKYGPWRYQVLSEAEAVTHLRLYANTEFETTARVPVSSVTFQPCLNEDERSQDRRVVQSWELRDGRWTFVGVFDGHAGHETVDHAIVEIPLRLKAKLESLLEESYGTSLSQSLDLVSSILADGIAAYDESLLEDFASLFPGGLDGIIDLSEYEIKEIINDANRGGENLRKVHRCMRGSTALVSLVDPSREHLWVVNLGDCQAVLGKKSPDGKWNATPLTSNHNGENEAEVKRIRGEHPGEDECILRQRVLGAIAVTRALGDYVFKLPRIFTSKVFMLAKPGFIFRSRVEEWISRNVTPPYISRHPEVHYHHFSEGGQIDGVCPRGYDAFLIMCSDGLTDRYRNVTDFLAHWAKIVGPEVEGGRNAALALLWDALGGDAQIVSRYMTLENTERWMDDTTIAVLAL